MSGHPGFGARRWGNGRGASLLIGAGLALLSGCSAGPATEDGGSSEQGITGGDAADVTLSPFMPQRAVGFVSLPGGSCSGTLIERNLVLTAAHCLADSGTTSAQVAAGNVTFTMSYSSGGKVQTFTLKSTGFSTLATDAINSGKGNASPDERYSDLAVIFMDRNVTTEEVPTIPHVLTTNASAHELGDLLDIPAHITGYAGNINVKKTATLTQGIEIDQDCGVLGLGSCGAQWLRADAGSGQAQIQSGDSGGPLSEGDNIDNRTTLVGVNSGKHSPAVGTDSQIFSATFNIGATPTDNGDWLAQFLVDGDDDGIDDAIDNCPPARCNNDNNLHCANPNQDDTDNDGIGDACDNCPGALCQKLFGDAHLCANPSQDDATDHDGIGDACDMCPSRLSTPLDPDFDGDTIVDSCDNCQRTRNAPLACTSNAECQSAGQGDCIGVDNAELRVFGRCDGGSAVGQFCGTNRQCPLGICRGIGTFGRCAGQTNTDGDAFGDACDVCPTTQNDELTTNSNAEAEQREGVDAQGDVCDVAPTYVPKPIIREAGQAGEVTTFLGSSGIGSDTRFTASVGYRWCNCGGSALDAHACITQGLCDDDPSLFGAPDFASPWHRITTGTRAFDPNSTEPPAAPSGVFDRAPVTHTFTNDVNCEVNIFHALGTDESGPCNIGSREYLYWFTDQDIAQNHVQTYQPGFTSGLIWSHVLTTDNRFSDGAKGTRDAQTQGRLRDVYVKVSTPQVAIEVPRIEPPVAPSSGCTTCAAVFRRDWLVDSDLTLVSKFARISDIARLIRSDASLLAERERGLAVFDVASDLTDKLSLFSAADTRFLTPVETGARGASFSRGLQWATLPLQWIAGESVIRTAIMIDGKLFRNDELAVKLPPGGGDIDHPFPGGTFGLAAATSVAAAPEPAVVGARPGNRYGARGVLSGTENAVYMIGGTHGDQQGPQTGEIWRYDLRAGAWEQRFTPTSGVKPNLHPNAGQVIVTSRPGQYQPGEVLAVAYDSERGTLLVLDRMPTKHHKSLVRLLRYDTKSQRSSLLREWPASEKIDRYGLVALSDGSFILVTNERHHFTAHTFEISRHGSVKFTRIEHGDAAMVDDPINTTYATYLPVSDGRIQFLQRLGTHADRHDSCEPEHM